MPSQPSRASPGQNSFNEAPAKGGGEFRRERRPEFVVPASMRPPQKAGGNNIEINEQISVTGLQ